MSITLPPPSQVPIEKLETRLLIRVSLITAQTVDLANTKSYANIRSLTLNVKLFTKKFYMPKINRLADVFGEKNTTNREIAKHIKKSEETVSRWANNHRQPPLDDLYKIAKYLQVDIRELLHPSEWVQEK